MNNEEKYEMALEALQEVFSGGDEFINMSRLKLRLQPFFPELKENDDEKIRKAIVEFFEQQDDNTTYSFVPKQSILAWLKKQGESKIAWHSVSEEPEELEELLCEWESDDATWHDVAFYHANTKTFWKLKRKIEGVTKWAYVNNTEPQGEQKGTNAIEPKFKVGDWIINGRLYTALVLDIENDKYFAEFVDGSKGFQYIYYVDNHFHLWTIADAKEGDVLVNGSNIFIFYSIVGTRLMGYCHVNTDDGRFYNDIGKNECFCLIDDVVEPATKEQRDLLFQKMKEAGYEWSDEEKELKKIKQSNEDVNMCEAVKDVLVNNTMSGSDGRVVYSEEIEWLESLKKKLTETK